MTRALPVLFLLLAAIALGATCDTANQPTAASGSTAPAPGTQLGGSGLYIALGDSLSAGIGASDSSKTFVGLVHASLGPGVELLNLGVPGATSGDLLSNGTLDRAVSEITQRDRDGDQTNDVQIVTLEIGGNDLLVLFSSLVVTGICPDVETGFQKPECVSALRAALDAFRPNLTAALDKLKAADPSLPVLLSTLYNPLGHIPRFGELGDLSIEGLPNTQFPEGLNDITREVAQGRDDVTVVDMYAPFRGRTQELISGDIIHPNDAGYQVMADALIEALR